MPRRQSQPVLLKRDRLPSILKACTRREREGGMEGLFVAVEKYGLCRASGFETLLSLPQVLNVEPEDQTLQVQGKQMVS